MASLLRVVNLAPPILKRAQTETIDAKITKTGSDTLDITNILRIESNLVNLRVIPLILPHVSTTIPLRVTIVARAVVVDLNAAEDILALAVRTGPPGRLESDHHYKHMSHY